MTKFDRFYSSLKSFSVFIVIGIIFGVLSVVSYAVNIPFYPHVIQSVLYTGFMLCLMIGLSVSSRKHEMKVMYVIVGALIGARLLSAFSAFTYYFEVGGMDITTDHALAFCVLIAVFFISFANLFTTHKSAKGTVRFNAIVGIVAIAFEVYSIIGYIILLSSGSVDFIYFAAYVSNFIMNIMIINVVTSVAFQLNGYKLERESAMAEGTWTDEKKAETKQKYFGE